MTPTERMYSELDTQDKKGADLCRYLGINTSILAGWKSQNTIPPAKYLVGISEFLNVTVDYLLTGNGKQPPDTRQPTFDKEAIEVLGLWKQLDQAGQSIIKGAMYERIERQQPDLIAARGGKNVIKITDPTQRGVIADFFEAAKGEDPPDV